MSVPRERLLKLAEGISEQKRRKIKRECEASLTSFIRYAWPVIEPGQEYVHGWHIDAMAEHLEAITHGVEIDEEPYNRLLMNVPPGMMKSLLVGVFWPAWEWGPRNMPHLRYVCASHSVELAIRDSVKMRRLIMSDWYQKLWGDRVKLTDDQNAKGKFENVASGFRQAIAADGITGARGDRVLIDDPHSVTGANSEQMRQTTNEWFLEAVPLRLNNPKRSAIVVIMQRLHEDDISGVILSKLDNYDHLMLPMMFDPDRRCETRLGYIDPREKRGELLFPERFPQSVVDRDSIPLGPFGVAGQFQQSPIPRGGGILKAAWWPTWVDDASWPTFDFILASLDTAYTEKQENDYSAMTVWGVYLDHPRFSYFRDGEDQRGTNRRRIMLIDAWQERLEFNALVSKVAKAAKKCKVDRIVIEAKASGISVAQELTRLHSRENWGVQTINPGNLDKVARAHSVVPLFADGVIVAPDKDFAQIVIDNCATFPKGKHDDLTDSAVQAIRYMREIGLAELGEELQAAFVDQAKFRPSRNNKPIYVA